MGRSADAYLVYGVEINLVGDYGEVPWKEHLDPYFDEDEPYDEEILTYLVGGLEPKRYEDCTEKEIHAYWAEKRACHEKLGVDFLFHGYSEEADCVLIAKPSKVWSSWGETTEVASLDVKPEWDENLKRTCEKLGIIFEPKWMLLASYG